MKQLRYLSGNFQTQLHCRAHSRCIRCAIEGTTLVSVDVDVGEFVLREEERGCYRRYRLDGDAFSSFDILSRALLTRVSIGKPTLVSYAGRYWIDHAARIGDYTRSEAWQAFFQLVDSTGRHVERPWEAAYGRPDALEACDSPRTSAVISTLSEYFSTSYFSPETLALTRWAVRNDNAALINTIDLAVKGKKSTSKTLGEDSICNTLNSVIHLSNEPSPQSRDMICKVLHARLMKIDSESSYVSVIDWHAAALFDLTPSKTAFPTGWRKDCFSSLCIGDLNGIKPFQAIRLALSDTVQRERLGSFEKHASWDDLGDKDILVHPMMLAVILDHSNAAGWMHGALENTDPFASGIDPFDLILDCLRYGLICDRKEICYRLLAPIYASDKPLFLKKTWRVARVLMWAQLRGYREVSERLLECAIREEPQQILQDIKDCKGDAKNSLLFYFVEFRDLTSLSILLSDRDGEKIKSPVTANGTNIIDFVEALVNEMGPSQDGQATALLQDIQDLIKKNFSSVETDKISKVRKNSFGDELRSIFSISPSPSEKDSDSDQEDSSSSSPGHHRARRATQKEIFAEHTGIGVISGPCDPSSYGFTSKLSSARFASALCTGIPGRVPR